MSSDGTQSQASYAAPLTLNQTTPVFVSNNNGKTWNQTPGEGILVISPGAGTFANSLAYINLSGRFSVSTADTQSRAGGFKYPQTWNNITTVDLETVNKEEDSLVGLAKAIGEDIIAKKKPPPSLIVAGSRGSQVVLPLLLLKYWRGPFVAINAGPLTSNTPLPTECTPCFVTCGGDYFPTKSPAFVMSKFIELAAPGTEGFQVHLPRDAHMPDLESTPARKALLGDLCLNLINGTQPRQTMLNGSASVIMLKKVLSRPPASTVTALQNRPGLKQTILRSSPSTERNWAPTPNIVYDGEELKILADEVDENGYLILKVQSNSGAKGWLYAMHKKFHTQ